MCKSFIIFTLLFSLVTNADEACNQSYEKMYSDGELTLSVYLGYNDAREDHVADPMYKSMYVDIITAVCDKTKVTELCGFSRDPDDADIFTKTITRANGKSEVIKLKMKNAAVTDSNRTNMGAKKSEQDKRSKEFEDSFLNDLQNDDVVLYNGHSRYGTGPAYKPMGSEDWKDAVNNKPTLNRMIQTLKTAKKTPGIIGMISCDSESHYGKALHEAAPNSGLILTRQITSFGDTRRTMLSSIDSILQKQCGDSFRSGMKAATQNIFNPSSANKDIYPDIYGFFEANKKKFAPPHGAILKLVNGEYHAASPPEVAPQRPQPAQQKPAGSSK